MKKELTVLFSFLNRRDNIITQKELKENIVNELMDEKYDKKEVRELLDFVSKRIEANMEPEEEPLFVLFEGFEHFCCQEYLPHEIEYFDKFARLHLLKFVCSIALAAKQNVPLVLAGRYKLPSNFMINNYRNSGKTINLNSKFKKLQHAINEILYCLSIWEQPYRSNSLKVYALTKDRTDSMFFASYPHIKSTMGDTVLEVGDCHILHLNGIDVAIKDQLFHIRAEHSMNFSICKNFIQSCIEELSDSTLNIKTLKDKLTEYKSILKLCLKSPSFVEGIWNNVNKLIKDKIKAMKSVDEETVNKVNYFIMNIPNVSLSASILFKSLLFNENTDVVTDEFNTPVNYISSSLAFINNMPEGLNQLTQILDAELPNMNNIVLINETVDASCFGKSKITEDKELNLMLVSGRKISRSNVEYINLASATKTGLMYYHRVIAPPTAVICPITIKFNGFRNNRLIGDLQSKSGYKKIGFDSEEENESLSDDYDSNSLTIDLLEKIRQKTKDGDRRLLLGDAKTDDSQFKKIRENEVYDWLSKLDYLASDEYDFVAYASENEFDVVSFSYVNGKKVENNNTDSNSNDPATVVDKIYEFRESINNNDNSDVRLNYNILNLSARFATAKEIDNEFNFNNFDENISAKIKNRDASINDILSVYSKDPVRIAMEKHLKYLMTDEKSNLDGTLVGLNDYTFCKSLSKFTILLTEEYNLEMRKMVDYDNVYYYVVSNSDSNFESVKTNLEILAKNNNSREFSKSIKERRYHFIPSNFTEPVIRYMQAHDPIQELEGQHINNSGLALALMRLINERIKDENNIMMSIISRYLPDNNYVLNYLHGYTQLQVMLWIYILMVIAHTAEINNFKLTDIKNYLNLNKIFELVSGKYKTKQTITI